MVIMLATGMFTNISFIIYALSCSPFELFPAYFFRAFLRAENAAFALQFYIMFLLARNFSSQKGKRFPDIFKYFTAASILYFVYLGTYCLFAQNVFLSPSYLFWYPFWATIVLIEGFTAVWIMYKNYKTEQLNLLRYHVRTLAFFYMLPYCILKVFENPFFSSLTSTFPMLPASSLTSLWLTCIIYYCARKLVGTRFLNMEKHVVSPNYNRLKFIDDFRGVIARLSTISSVDEIQPITKSFFEKVFGVPSKHVSFMVRENKKKKNKEAAPAVEGQAALIENAFSVAPNDSLLVNLVFNNRILIRDEVEFTHFYTMLSDEELEYAEAADFLRELKADVFVPIFYDSRVIGAIMVDLNSRPNKFYNDVERDEMVVYANYLGSIIYLLVTMNLAAIIERERALATEVYRKNKVLGMLRKSIYAFITSKKQDIGLLTYKNRKFSYINNAAKELLNADLNNDKGLEITQKIAGVANEVATFSTPKRILIDEKDGEGLTVSIAPNLDKSMTFVTVAPSSITDILKDSMNHLSDQSKWNFLLGLRTTSEGKLVDTLLPADTAVFTNIKVNFLEMAITRKSLLLEMVSEEDALSFAHVAHKINNRKLFELLELDRNTADLDIAHKLFGMNPLFEKTDRKGLLEAFDMQGTIYIKNIQLLGADLQKQLLEYLKTGKYTPLKSEESRESDVLFICSSDQNLNDLVARGLFNADLYSELRKVAVVLPPLFTLTQEDQLALIEGLRTQIVMTKMYQNLLVLTEGDKRRLIESTFMSLHEVKRKLQGILFQKTRRQSLKDTNVIDPGATISDLDLVAAARLGRHVLKDPKMLAMLLKKFNNSQNRVAQFLGVNRSTVHRRCHQYNLQTGDFD